MSKKQKFYVVWQGKNPGIYKTWDECKEQIQGVAAKYKSFDTLAEAEYAFQKNYDEFYGLKGKKNFLSEEVVKIHGKPIGEAIAVDAAFNGKTKMLEYQGVFVETSSLVFKYGLINGGTNNIGEFLAIVHALSLQKKHKTNYPIYTDSLTAISWIKQKYCKTELEVLPENKKIFQIIQRAEKWLRENSISEFQILKWKTEVWGDIPADFGRK